MKKGLHTRGFTLAEILITLVIIGFVAALGVPMLGQKRVQKPTLDMGKHGTIECYYENDTLYQFTSDNVDDKQGTVRVAEEGYCSFEAPSAGRFVFQVIGAGEDGYSDDFTPQTNQNNLNETGVIRVDSSFQRDLRNAPEWVREFWDRQWDSGNNPTVRPTYTLLSPVGKAGRGKCEPVLISQGLGDSSNLNCQVDGCSVDILNSCPEECIVRKTADGGDSGKQGKVTATVNEILSSSDISFTANDEETFLKIGNAYIKLSPSGDGGNAVYNTYIAEAVKGPNGADWSSDEMEIQDYGSGTVFSSTNNSNTELFQSGGSGEDACNSTISYGNKIAGSITVNPASIAYHSYVPGLRAHFMLAGAPGANVTRLFESIPAGTEFRLQPANASKSIIDSKVQMKGADGSWKDLVWANKDSTVQFSGDRGMVLDQTFPVRSSEDLPFDRTYYPDAFLPLSPSILVSSVNGYTSKIATLNLEPGKSGAGTFKPYLSGLSAYPTYTINNVQVESSANVTISPEEGIADNFKCPDGSDLYDGRFCKGTQGNPGAIIISW